MTKIIWMTNIHRMNILPWNSWKIFWVECFGHWSVRYWKRQIFFFPPWKLWIVHRSRSPSGHEYSGTRIFNNHTLKNRARISHRTQIFNLEIYTPNWFWVISGLRPLLSTRRPRPVHTFKTNYKSIYIGHLCKHMNSLLSKGKSQKFKKKMAKNRVGRVSGIPNIFLLNLSVMFCLSHCTHYLNTYVHVCMYLYHAFKGWHRFHAAYVGWCMIQINKYGYVQGSFHNHMIGMILYLWSNFSVIC